VASGISMNNAKRTSSLAGGFGFQAEMGDLAPARGQRRPGVQSAGDTGLPADALQFENLKLEGGKLRVADPAKPPR